MFTPSRNTVLARQANAAGATLSAAAGDHLITEPGGVRIFARPFSGGVLAANYAAHGSGVYPTGSGNGTGFFTISSGPAVVDQIRFQMWNADQTTLLFETLIPVYYQ